MTKSFDDDEVTLIAEALHLAIDDQEDSITEQEGDGYHPDDIKWAKERLASLIKLQEKINS